MGGDALSLGWERHQQGKRRGDALVPPGCRACRGQLVAGEGVAVCPGQSSSQRAPSTPGATVSKNCADRPRPPSACFSLPRSPRLFTFASLVSRPPGSSASLVLQAFPWPSFPHSAVPPAALRPHPPAQAATHPPRGILAHIQQPTRSPPPLPDERSGPLLSLISTPLPATVQFYPHPIVHLQLSLVNHPPAVLSPSQMVVQRRRNRRHHAAIASHRRRD
jgi:hypothetical protein